MIKASPFHSRAADANQDNAWAPRAGFTLSQFYSGVEEEVLSARASAVMSDISFRVRLRVSGRNAADFLSRLATQDIQRLEIGEAVAALWLDDAGLPKGEGIVARQGREAFVIETQSDTGWIENAAALFGLALTREEAGLIIIGPASEVILQDAGLSMPAPMSVHGTVWQGLDISVSHFGLGVEIWCKADDAVLVWDHLARAGEKYALLPAGLAALDILEMECAGPRSQMVDENHTGFNGRDAYLRRQTSGTKTIIGLDIDSDTPAPFAQLVRHVWVAGRVLKSLYSPALGRVIALAEVDKNAAETGTDFTLTLPPDENNPEPRKVMARAVTLPFLPI